MRTIVCFGHDGLGEIEVSPRSDNVVSRESFPTVFYEEYDSTAGRPREEIRLFHKQPLIVEEEEDDDDDIDIDEDDGQIVSEYEEELSFEGPNSVTSDTSDDDEKPSVQETTSSATSTKPNSSSSRIPSKDVLAVIDHLEQNVDMLHKSHDESDPSGEASSSCNLLSLQRVIARFRPQQQSSTQKLASADDNPPAKVSEKKVVASKASKPKKKPSTWNNLFPLGRSRHSKKLPMPPDTALLIPHKTEDSNWIPSDDPDDKPEPATSNDGTENMLLKKGRFLHRLLLGGCFSAFYRLEGSEGIVEKELNQIRDVKQDETRSLSLEDESEDDDVRVERTFRNDEELVDHLVKVCDKNSSLEEGFNCLQERIRCHSYGKESPKKLAETQPRQGAIFSSPILDMGSKCPSKETEKAKPYVPSVVTLSPGPPQSAPPSSIDPINDTIPSFASLEEFLSSVNDSDNSASLEALLFEQELEKLSPEELASLLDEELEKLMREGLV